VGSTKSSTVPPGDGKGRGVVDWRIPKDSKTDEGVHMPEGGTQSNKGRGQKKGGGEKRGLNVFF